MKTKILLVALLLSSITIFAQNSEKKPSGYISLNGGSSTPLGDFADNTIGGALGGTDFTINFSVPFSKSHFGLATTLSTCSFATSDAPFIKQQQDLLTKFNVASYTYKITPKSSAPIYSQYLILTGLYTTIPFTKRLNMDSRILFGTSIMSRPELTIDIIDYTDGFESILTQSSSSSTSFAYDFGFGFHLNLGKKQKLCLMVSLDFVGSDGSFETDNYSLYENFAHYLQGGKNKSTQKYSTSTWNSTIGLGYVFGKR